eukprot:g5866.t1
MRQMRRGKIGRVTGIRVGRGGAVGGARMWVLSAGGQDDAASTYFMQRWRRFHRYVAPPVEKTILNGVIDTYALWRSQLPPDGPNFAVVTVAALRAGGAAASQAASGSNSVGPAGLTMGATVLVNCGLANLQLGGAAGASALLAPLELAAQPPYKLVKKKMARFGMWFKGLLGGGPSLNTRLAVSISTVNADESILPRGMQVTRLQVGGLDAIVVETLPLDPTTGERNPKWFGAAPELTAQETAAVTLTGKVSRGVDPVDEAQLIQVVAAAAEAIDALPIATLVAEEDLPPEGVDTTTINLDMPTAMPMAFAVELPEGAAPLSTLLVQPPNGAAPMMVQVPPAAEEMGAAAGGAASPSAPPARALMPTRSTRQMIVHMPDSETGVPTTEMKPLLLDTTEDGKIDTVGIDSTKDGQVDKYCAAVLIDTIGDGAFDSVALDSTGDGQYDMVLALSADGEEGKREH